MTMLLIAGLILLAIAAVVSYPLIFQPLEPYATPSAAAAEFSERDALLEALSDLELSFRTGKLSDADFQAQKLQLERQYLTELGEK